MLCLCVLCKYVNGNVYKHSVVFWRAGASQPSRRTDTIFLYNWRAGASQPSRTTGAIFLYNIYIYFSTGASFSPSPLDISRDTNTAL